MYRDQDTVNQARVSIGLPSAFLTGSKCKIAYIYLNIKGKKFKQNSCFTIEKNVVLKSCWLHTIFVIVSLIVFHVELVILLPLVHIKILLLPSYLVYGHLHLTITEVVSLVDTQDLGSWQCLLLISKKFWPWPHCRALESRLKH